MRSKDGAVVGFVGIIQPVRSAEESLDTMQRLHAITADASLGHAERINAVLALGLDHFGLDIAIQSHIYGDEYLVEHCVDESGGLAPLMKFELPGTYCAHTVNASGAVGFHYAGKSEIREHPCYLNFKLESYIGARIKIGERLYGTINFSGREATEPFSKDDYILVQLLADTLGYLIYKHKQDERLWELATTDELTGLANRRSTLERLEQHVKLSHRSGMPLTVVSIDLDHFKSINDSWGHHGGDTALLAFSKVASCIGRTIDFCGRMGGEEFVLVLPDTSCNGGLVAAEYLRERLAATPVRLDKGESIALTVSAGVASLETGETLDSLLARADEAMYIAKQSGRNQVCVYKPKDGD
jgi:diguanylate cyclase (GGDEF)-like protein